MNKIDFINSVVGLPWVEGSSDPAKGLDCFGLVEYSYAAVDRIILPRLAGRARIEVGAGFQAALGTGAYEPCEEKEGAIWGLLDSASDLVHVGRILEGKALHSCGQEFGGGGVVAWPFKIAKRLYSRNYKFVFYEVAHGND